MHRLADVWFSVHVKDVREPIYVSEVMERSMNPSFAFFDLDTISSRIGRLDECTLRVWAKEWAREDSILLLEMKINLRSLQFIGKHLEDFHHPLPENAVLLHLSDGIYTSFTDLPGIETGSEVSHVKKSNGLESGSSFDALMQLANLDDCVQDALKVREQLEQDVSDLLVEVQGKQTSQQLRAEREERLAGSRSAVATLTRQKAHHEKRKEDLKKSLQARRQAVEASRKSTRAQQRHETLTRSVEDQKKELHRLLEQSQGQVRRIGEALLTIFPIEAMQNKALQFSIRNIHLPNSVFDDTNRDEIAAGLGLTGQLVQLLSLYLVTPLPYPIDANASNSSIQDPISISIAQRRYPLYPTNVAYKFEYGVFLLNKDIEFLMCKAGLRVLDIRHTLPNLKYLLYILTAGSGELPARKSGGVRGLLGGRFTPNLSRRGSEESVTGSREYTKRASFASKRNGSITAVQIPKEKQEAQEDPFVASPSMMAMPHRQQTSIPTTGR